MKKTPSIIYALCFMLCIGFADAAPLTGTSGSNLTGFNGATGAMNNNAWNAMINPRANGPTADFGNCNALILRCATPKCATGGCTSMEIAYPIVSGCVLASNECKGHGDALTQSIAAQIVANSNAKSAAAANNAATAAAQNIAAQSDAQMQQMQFQMQQMQAQMAEQNAAAMAAQQAAIAQQQEMLAAQLATQQIQSSPQTPDPRPQTVAAGVSADVLAREQASGQIYQQLENAQTSLNDLKKTMQNAFRYGGCSENTGDNCAGPKRVAAFKQKAGEFFDPYENVLDEVYDALIMAQSLGVDITDILMMLNGSCNSWGKYLCQGSQTMFYDATTCMNGRSLNTSAPCVYGGVIPVSDGGCQLVQMLNNSEDVQQNWLNPEVNGTGVNRTEVRVGCASQAIESSGLFRNRKKQASIDIETLRQILDQEPPNSLKTNAAKYCNVAGYDGDLSVLESLAQRRVMTTTSGAAKNVCYKLGTDGNFTAENKDSECEYINPIFAMCNVHAYNAGLTENTKDARQKVSEIIGLKTTIMAQQMKKQYDYLDTTMRRFKTQLEKAILVSKMEAAGASSESTSGAKSTNRNILLNGASDCSTMYTSEDVLKCLGSNLNTVAASTDKTNARKQLEIDAKMYNSFNSKDPLTKCAGLTNSNVPACIDEYRMKLIKANSEQSSRNRTTGGYMMVP